ncbi:MAG: late competence development ComFB family protein [Lachnospiraceae bacterium]|nr:late competence development ComFB family protein [Lachnospiraceae bacterium]
MQEFKQQDVRNIMEDIVAQKLDSVIDSLGCCTCEKCRADIMAYVLNHVTPRYVASEKGELFSKVQELNQNNNTDIVMKIVSAAEIIKERPKHDV